MLHFTFESAPAISTNLICLSPVLSNTIHKVIDMLNRILGNSKQINAIVEGCVSELSRRYPPSMATGQGRKLSPQAVTNILESALSKLVTQTQQFKLGWLGKARLANDLKWSLAEKGYPEKFIELFIEAVIVYITRKSAKTGE